MIRFLLKGLLRDRHRSLFPFIVVASGVSIAVFAFCFLQGMVDETVRSNAKLETGHVKITTRGYRELARQVPNDLAVPRLGGLLRSLERDYPRVEWAPRIKFAGLLDLPDERGETRSQGPAMGFALDLFGARSREIERLQLADAIEEGRLPRERGEILISAEFAARLGARPGDVATFIGSTANGALAAENFVVAGTVRFGIGPLDRSTVIADVADMQYALDMSDAASEVLGFFPNLVYDDAAADTLAASFNGRQAPAGGQFTPVMVTLREQGGLGEYLDVVEYRMSLVLIVFFFVMSIVLWNAGLMSGIRRYGEIGVRLAIGESKSGIYTALIAESLLVGIAGSAAGTAVGLALSYYMQEVGMDISAMMKGSNVLMANVMRARITPASWYIGFLPGMLATLVGTAVSGIGIFRRQTAQLFKELEA